MIQPATFSPLDLSSAYTPGDVAWKAPPAFPQADAMDFSPLGQAFQSGGASALFEFNYQSVHAISETRDGGRVTREEFFQESLDIRLTVQGDPKAAEELMARLKEAFTPEKVAGRILDFALSGFAPAGAGDGAVQRQGYADWIQKAIQQGYDQARQVLGKLDDATAGSLDETLKRIREGLAAFVQGKQDTAPPVPL